jgi:FtsH-binding integral membrane protein
MHVRADRVRLEVRVGAYSNPYAVPVIEAADDARSGFLRRVGMWTFGGLLVAGAASLFSTAAIVFLPPLQNQWVALAVMFGSMFGARAIGSNAVYSENEGTRMAGFVAGTGLQGIAMGYLILAATLASYQQFANPFVFLFQGIGLVGLTVAGMVGYLLTGPKNLSMVGGALAALSLPMLGIMIMTAIWPVNGVFGVILSLVFVGVSAGGLLFNLNQVMHKMSTNQVIPAAYHVSLGILVLFWNVVSLLMRLNRR